MFIKQAYQGNHELWRWLVGIVVIFIGWQVIGAMPLGFAVVSKLMAEGNFSVTIEESDLLTTLSSNTTFFLLLLSFAFGMLTWYIWVRASHRLSFRQATTTRKRFSIKRVLFAFAMVAIFQLLSLGLGLWLAPEQLEWNFKPEPFFTLLAIAVIMIPIQTVFEEIFFRSYLTQGAGVIFGSRAVALIVPSLLFGLAHGLNPEVATLGYGIMPFYILTGLLLGIFTLMDEGIELACGFHIANNLLIAVLVTTDWGAFQTESLFRDVSEPSLGMEMIISLLIFYPLLLFVFSKTYKWSDWKEKLLGEVDPPPSQKHTHYDSRDTSTF